MKIYINAYGDQGSGKTRTLELLKAVLLSSGAVIETTQVQISESYRGPRPGEARGAEIERFTIEPRQQGKSERGRRAALAMVPREDGYFYVERDGKNTAGFEKPMHAVDWMAFIGATGDRRQAAKAALRGEPFRFDGNKIIGQAAHALADAVIFDIETMDDAIFATGARHNAKIKPGTIFATGSVDPLRASDERRWGFCGGWPAPSPVLGFSLKDGRIICDFESDGPLPDQLGEAYVPKMTATAEYSPHAFRKSDWIEKLADRVDKIAIKDADLGPIVGGSSSRRALRDAAGAKPSEVAPNSASESFVGVKVATGLRQIARELLDWACHTTDSRAEETRTTADRLNGYAAELAHAAEAPAIHDADLTGLLDRAVNARDEFERLRDASQEQQADVKAAGFDPDAVKDASRKGTSKAPGSEQPWKVESFQRDFIQQVANMMHIPFELLSNDWRTSDDNEWLRGALGRMIDRWEKQRAELAEANTARDHLRNRAEAAEAVSQSQSDVLFMLANLLDGYAEHHDAKGTEESASKAERNRRWARHARGVIQPLAGPDTGE